LDADLRFYTTEIAMQDLDQVRAALGYPQINLYGASYGTRAALEYLRQFPEKTRTVILDGVAPPNWILGPTSAADAQRALEAIFNRCQEETACAQAFPHVAAEFQSLLEQLDQSPVEVQLDHPLTGEPTSYTLDRNTFANAVHLLSYTSETVVLLPVLIHSTYAEQDFRRFAAQALTTFENLEQSLSNGMRFSVLCAEDAPFYSEQPNSQGYLGDLVTTAFSEICTYWPSQPVPADFHQPVQSDIPVLLLSGAADPATPPANGELAAKNLSNSQHWIVPSMGHINIYRGCIPNLATDFINQASFDGIDPTCIQDITPMPFFLNFNGPIP
jgi:pimeloyl-ACP methyl ester carboxylesterase